MDEVKLPIHLVSHGGICPNLEDDTGKRISLDQVNADEAIPVGIALLKEAGADVLNMPMDRGQGKITIPTKAARKTYLNPGDTVIIVRAK